MPDIQGKDHFRCLTLYKTILRHQSTSLAVQKTLHPLDRLMRHGTRRDTNSL